jgi:hypothetical protein
MAVRDRAALDSFLVFVVSRVSLLTSCVVFRCVSRLPNPVPRADSFSIAMRSWPS